MEDLEFADDPALLFYSVNYMQVKTKDLEASVALVGYELTKTRQKL